MDRLGSGRGSGRRGDAAGPSRFAAARAAASGRAPCWALAAATAAQLASRRAPPHFSVAARRRAFFSGKIQNSKSVTSNENLVCTEY